MNGMRQALGFEQGEMVLIEKDVINKSAHISC